MADSRSYSMDEKILKLYNDMSKSLAKKSRKPIELILETALNNPDKFRDYLMLGARSFPPFDLSQGFNNAQFISTIIDLADNKLLYNLIIQTKRLESKVSKNVYAEFDVKNNVLLLKCNEKTSGHHIEINVSDIVDVDLFDTIKMKCESYKYINNEKQPSYMYIRIKMYKDYSQNEV